MSDMKLSGSAQGSPACVIHVNSFRGLWQFEIRERGGCVGFQREKRTLVSNALIFL